MFVERNAQFNRWKKLTWKNVFFFIIGSISFHVEEYLGFSINLNNLLSPRTQDCVDVSHLKISWELMKSGVWYWCDNYAREDMTNSQCKMTRWKLVECQKEKTEARLIDHRVCLRCLPKPQWLASCVWKYFFSGFVWLFPLGSEYSFGWSVIRLLRPHLTWLWKVSGRWRGELPIGETPAEG